MNLHKSVDDALDVLLLPGRMQEQVDGAGAQALGNGADNAFVIDALGVILLGAERELCRAEAVELLVGTLLITV